MNWAICVGIFLPLYLVLMISLGGFLAFAISLALVFCLFFFVLQYRAIAIVCPNPACGKVVKTNTPWICGFKECRNDDVDRHPFVGSCQCGADPKAYQCHHCGELIFLTEDEQRANYARCVNSQAAKDPHDEDIAKRKKEIELAELDLRKAEFDVQLKEFGKKLDPQKPKSVGDRLKTKFSSKVELEDAVRELQAKIDEEFKDDDVEREKRHLALKAAARDTLM